MTLKKGDKVVMHSCAEADHDFGKIWTCATDSYDAVFAICKFRKRGRQCLSILTR